MSGGGTQKFASVEAYLASVPEAHRAALETVRERIHAAAPGLVETISYHMPTFVLEGKPVVWLGAFRHHCSLFPGSIRFAPDAPLPAAEVKRIVKARIAENRALGANKTATKGAARKATASKKAPKKAAAAKKTMAKKTVAGKTATAKRGTGAKRRA